MDILIGVGIFIATLSLIEGGFAVWRTLRDPEKKKVRQRLTIMSLAGQENEEGLERKTLLSEVPWLNQLLLNIVPTRRMNLLLEQAGIRKPLGFFVLLSLVLAVSGFMAGTWVTISGYLAAAPLAIIGGAAPYFYVIARRKRRMDKFERQLPEALDLMARALKAGHAFTGALKMVADELDDPIGREFDKALGEINFGIDVSEALINLSRRVDCPDLRFFVISIIIQRETGGNLAQILENIAYLIRERFKLHGRVSVLAAEGKLSAYILIALPFLVALALAFLNPDYLQPLVNDPIGRFMSCVALAMMAVGIVVMKKMVVIKV